MAPFIAAGSGIAGGAVAATGVIAATMPGAMLVGAAFGAAGDQAAGETALHRVKALDGLELLGPLRRGGSGVSDGVSVHLSAVI